MSHEGRFLVFPFSKILEFFEIFQTGFDSSKFLGSSAASANNAFPSSYPSTAQTGNPNSAQTPTAPPPVNGSNVPPAVHPGEYIQPANNYYPNQGQYYHQRDCVKINET